MFNHDGVERSLQLYHIILWNKISFQKLQKWLNIYQVINERKETLSNCVRNTWLSPKIGRSEVDKEFAYLSYPTTREVPLHYLFTLKLLFKNFVRHVTFLGLYMFS